MKQKLNPLPVGDVTNRQQLKIKLSFRHTPLRWVQSHLSTIWRTSWLTRTKRARIATLSLLALFLVGEGIILYKPFFDQNQYSLGTSASVLNPISPQMAKRVKFDTQNQSFSFNGLYVPSAQESTGQQTQAKAVAYKDPGKGVVVSDPSLGVDFNLVPKFGLLSGQQDGNRIVYPLISHAGWAVYSLHSVGVKEDIVLESSPGNNLTLDYELKLGQGQEARLESNGGVGIYGNELLSGNVATGSEADQKLLEKARQNAPKTARLFSLPPPVIVDNDGRSERASARFELEGTNLKVISTGLDKAQYPLSIDPSIYVVTAQQFMQGNNETNIDFNVSDKLIQKGRTTGARFDEWVASSTNLPAPSWRGATAAAGGYLYNTGGTTFNGQTFTSQGANSYIVPAGITSLTFKAWGGGGGGGAGAGTAATGGSGGGGGYVTSTITVTPGETLTIYVGGGGTGGSHSAGGGTNLAGGGGGGGGYTSVYRGGTPLLVAPGGGGGGGARNLTAGGAGGPGGCTTTASTCNGTGVGNGGGGGGASNTTGGSAGSGGNNSGVAGSSLNGGAGADGSSSTSGSDGSGAVGGGATGGNGGAPNLNITRPGGGGGGSGYYGGGGAGSTTSADSNAGGGGGGGASFTAGGSTGVTFNIGSGANPGNSGDTGRNGAGQGGTAGPAFNNGGKGAGGSLLITNGSGGSTVSNSLSWAYLNTDTGNVEGPDPGNGTCSGWCSTSAYNLPDARQGHATVAYNGYLYVIGGTNGTGTRVNTIYVAKLGANGEPRLWHPTNTDQTTWTYWHTTTTLSSTRSMLGAVAYNNRLYIVGGLTGAGTGTAVSTVEYADINPMGTIGSWTTGTALSGGNVMGHSLLTYNDRLYVIGGATAFNGAGTTGVRYIKLDSSGATTGGWQTNTNSLITGRVSGGGQMGAIWGGYIYISGGCSTQDAQADCTGIETDTEVASINADGSVGGFHQVGSVSSARIGASLVTWRNRIYHVGGCSLQNTTTGDCDTAMLGTVNQGEINQDGDASTVGQSSASGAGTCNAGASSTNCDTPSGIGNMLNAAVITNGYLYVFGGCTNNTCSTTSGDYAYTAISSTGVTSRPAACANGAYTNNIWCQVTANAWDLDTGVAASSPVVFNGRIYLVGGLTGSANTNSIDRATVNSDGSLSAFTRQTMTGADTGANALEAQSYLFAHARANPAAVATSPGNLFIFGGCTASSAAGCTNYSPDVHKCNLAASDGAVSGCNAANQLQIGTLPGASSDGLGLMSGTVYANYVYLMGGVGGNLTDLNTIRYAKINDSNNVVDADSGGVGGGDSWTQSPITLQNGRRRSSGFGYNGYLYVVGGFDANNGVLADIEFSKINVNDGSLVDDDVDGEFEQSAVVINQRWGLTVPISNSYAYAIGGCTVGTSPSGCTSRTNVLQTFQIYNNDSGAPAGYSTSANTYATNPNRIGASSTVYNGRLYLAGGCTSATDCTTAVDTVSYTTIDSATGELGAWTDSSSAGTGSLPALRTWGKLLSAGTSLYYIGGQDSTATNEQTSVYWISPDPSTGALTTWSTATNGLPGARTKFGAASWNNRLYVVGGLDGAAANSATVYISPQLNSGGNITSAWTTGTSFNVARQAPSVVAYANNLYLMGGSNGTNYFSDSQYVSIGYKAGTIAQSGNTVTGTGTAWTGAQVGRTLQYSDGSTATITAVGSGTSLTVDVSKSVAALTKYVIQDGSVGTWSYSTSLPIPLAGADAFAANGYIYLQGGRSAANTCDPVTLVAPISANTAISSGNNPTGVGEWYETNQRYTGARYGAASAYYEGKAYVLGGGCGATLTYASPVTQQTPVLSQPQIARYSIAIDTDSDVFPTNWLLNGVDNSIGAQWRLKYRSMHDLDGASFQNPNEDCGTSATMATMTTWGVDTSFGDVTLGLPGIYTPKATTNSTINCSRYYYFNVSVDSSRAYGYPDDVTRGPTITDLTLQFTADPSKRLMHGRTFTGGLQQPIDTPYYSQ